MPEIEHEDNHVEKTEQSSINHITNELLQTALMSADCQLIFPRVASNYAIRHEQSDTHIGLPVISMTRPDTNFITVGGKG